MILTKTSQLPSRKYMEKNSVTRRRKLPPLNFGNYMRSKQRLPLTYLVRS